MSTGRLGAGDTAIQPTIFDAKADLLTATAADTPARLAVGYDGETLVADSSATTGLRWQENYAAGKNVIINGDFNIWQRGTSFSTSGAWSFNADRFQGYMGSGTATLAQQTFTPGTAPVAGYEGTYFLRATAPASGGTFHFRQSIENVRTFAGQTVTLSFWAKASATTSLNTYFNQVFGSGGSATVNTTAQTNTITTSWARYTYTVALPSISGKTIGTGNYIEPYFVTVNNFTSSATIDYWGIQVEDGSVATAFQTATGTLAGELAACQRYYQRMTATANGNSFANGFAESTTIAVTHIPYKVTMRTAPTALEQSGTATDYKISHQNTNTTCSAVPVFANATVFAADVSFTVASGLTAGNGLKVVALTGNAYLAWSAEL